MNRLKYPQKFLLISFLFILPLALVISLLLTELNSRIEFTQKELYGTTYLYSLNQLWQHIPRRQLILQRQFYQNAQSTGRSPETQSPALLGSQAKIDQGFTAITKTDLQLGNILQTGDKLSNLQISWQGLRDGQEFAEFRNHDLLIDQLDRLRMQVVDASNLILDPDLDTYYLMDAIALKLPEMQKLLHKLMQTEAEIIFKKEITNEKKALLISLINSLNVYNTQLTKNLERAFKNNPKENLRNSLNIPLRNFVVQVSEINGYTNQLVDREKSSLTNSFYQNEMESTLEDSFTLWKQAIDLLDELLVYRIRGFEQRKELVSLVVTIVLIVIIYLFIGFYLSVMRTVAQLDKASKQMTLGGATSIHLDSRDELSMVVRSFNNVAIALRESEEKYRSIFENSVDGIFQLCVRSFQIGKGNKSQEW